VDALVLRFSRAFQYVLFSFFISHAEERKYRKKNGINSTRRGTPENSIEEKAGIK
jgi:hypothetical protein